MYEFLSGKIIQKNPTRLVLEVGGIGFDLAIPLSTSHLLGKAGEEARVLTHFVVREDSQQLFGFATEEERIFFRLLLSVTGIGPKVALTVLSGIGVSELRKAIIDGSIPTLTAISGIGRKTAERLIVELREKILLLEPRGEKDRDIPTRLQIDNRMFEDSVQALISLGYRRADAKKALQKVLSEKTPSSFSVEDLIRASLKYI
ncbi:MAG: Holliday junction branch migration protein RuvA [Candidatus Omnitrophica bacterium]|nr:Holliday junction branch migration protein RuvA [Candidatus Omnitrophota bacterium]